MTEISVEGMSVDFPLYHVESRSLKKRLFGMASDRLRRESNSRITVSAIRDVSFTIKSGDRVALVGSNGAGKTTLLRVLSGVFQPSAGKLRIDGTVGSLIDPAAGMDMDSTGRENIILRCLYRGMPEMEALKMAEEVAEFSGLNEFLDVPLRTYSSGMQVRLSFALATAINPSILLMDEWLSAGDSEFMDKAETKLGSLVTSADIMVIATHDDRIVDRWCNRVIRLESGKIASDQRSVICCCPP